LAKNKQLIRCNVVVNVKSIHSFKFTVIIITNDNRVYAKFPVRKVALKFFRFVSQQQNVTS